MPTIMAIICGATIMGCILNIVLVIITQKTNIINQIAAFSTCIIWVIIYILK